MNLTSGVEWGENAKVIRNTSSNKDQSIAYHIAKLLLLKKTTMT